MRQVNFPERVAILPAKDVALGGGTAQHVVVVSAVDSIDNRQQRRRDCVLVVVPATAAGGVILCLPEQHPIGTNGPDSSLFPVAEARVEPGYRHHVEVTVAVQIADNGGGVQIATTVEGVAARPAAGSVAILLVDQQPRVGPVLRRRPRHQHLGAAVGGEVGQHQARQQRVQVPVSRVGRLPYVLAASAAPVGERRAGGGAAAPDAKHLQAAVVPGREEYLARDRALPQHHRRRDLSAVRLELPKPRAIAVERHHHRLVSGQVQPAQHDIDAAVQLGHGGVAANNRQAGGVGPGRPRLAVPLVGLTAGIPPDAGLEEVQFSTGRHRRNIEPAVAVEVAQCGSSERRLEAAKVAIKRVAVRVFQPPQVAAPHQVAPDRQAAVKNLEVAVPLVILLPSGDPRQMAHRTVVVADDIGRKIADDAAPGDYFLALQRTAAVVAGVAAVPAHDRFPPVNRALHNVGDAAVVVVAAEHRPVSQHRWRQQQHQRQRYGGCPTGHRGRVRWLLN